MSIMNRLKRMVQADAHAVLDTIEEPDALLRQAMRDMQSAQAVLGNEIEQLAQQQQSFESQQNFMQATLEEAEHDLEICLDEGNDELALHAVRRKLTAEKRLQQHTHTLGEITELMSQKKAQHGEQERQLKQIESQVQSQQGSFTESFASSMFEVSDEDAAIALLKQKQLRAASRGGES